MKSLDGIVSESRRGKLRRGGALLLSMAGIVTVIWLASVFLGHHPAIMTHGEKVRYFAHVNGSCVMRLTEGYGLSCYTEHGFNPVVWNDKTRNLERVFLFGDSFIEAFQVCDENKPDAVLTRNLGGNAVAIGVGSSGFGFPSMIVHAQECERVFGPPKAHVFFCASGIRNDVFEDGGSEWRYGDDGFALKPIGKSLTRSRMQTFINRFHLNFVMDINHAFKRIGPIFGSRKSEKGDSQSCEDDISNALANVMNSMKRSLRAPCIIVYAPNVPRIKAGRIVLDDSEQEDAEELKRSAESFGIGFLDVSQALASVWERADCFPRGFSNLGGPGNGHLNEKGIKAVFTAVASYLKENYAL